MSDLERPCALTALRMAPGGPTLTQDASAAAELHAFFDRDREQTAGDSPDPTPDKSERASASPTPSKPDDELPDEASVAPSPSATPGA